jgi:hypothetical protein
MEAAVEYELAPKRGEPKKVRLIASRREHGNR